MNRKRVKRRSMKSLINKALRRSPAYAVWRRSVFLRDNYTCVLCGARGVRLEADHIKSWSAHPQFRFLVPNGRTLCVPCHRKTPNYGWKALRPTNGPAFQVKEGLKK